MPYAIELYFDEDTEARVRSIWQALAMAGVSSEMLDVEARPHLSLTLLDDVDVDALCALVKDFADELTALDGEFSAVGTFQGDQGVVFLAPAVSADLLAMHRLFHTRLAELGTQGRSYYRPGRWFPHCTMAMGLEGEQRGAAIEICQAGKAFGPFSIREVGVVSFLPISNEGLFGLR